MAAIINATTAAATAVVKFAPRVYQRLSHPLRKYSHDEPHRVAHEAITIQYYYAFFHAVAQRPTPPLARQRRVSARVL